MDRNLSKLYEIVKDREAWHAAVHGLAKSRTRLSEWTTTWLSTTDEKKWLKIYMPKCQQHIFLMGVIIIYLFPYHGGSDGKESACNVGDLGSIPGSGRSLEKGIATYSSILAWRILWTEEPGGATVHVVSKSQTQQKRLTLSLFIISFYFPNFL